MPGSMISRTTTSKAAGWPLSSASAASPVSTNCTSQPSASRLKRRPRRVHPAPAHAHDLPPYFAPRVGLRPEEPGHPECRRLDRRVQSRGVESAADVRDIRELVEIAEHADAI